KKRSPLGVGDDIFEVGDRHPDRDSGLLVDVRAGAGESRNLLDDLLDVRGYGEPLAVPLEPGVVVADRHPELAGKRIMCADHGANAVLEWSDNPAAVGVVLGIRREGEAKIEAQTNWEAADLDVALLEDVKQPDLDLGSEVGELVDAEDSPVGPRDEPKMH